MPLLRSLLRPLALGLLCLSALPAAATKTDPCVAEANKLLTLETEPSVPLAEGLNEFVRIHRRWPSAAVTQAPEERNLYNRAYWAVKLATTELRGLEPNALAVLQQRRFFGEAAKRAHAELHRANNPHREDLKQQIAFWAEYGVDLLDNKLKPFSWPKPDEAWLKEAARRSPQQGPKPPRKLKPKAPPKPVETIAPAPSEPEAPDANDLDEGFFADDGSLPADAEAGSVPITEGEDGSAERIARRLQEFVSAHDRLPKANTKLSSSLELALLSSKPLGDRLDPRTFALLREAPLYRELLEKFYADYFAERLRWPNGELPEELERRLRMWQSFGEGMQGRDDGNKPYFGIKINAYVRTMRRLPDLERPTEREDYFYLLLGITSGDGFLSAIDDHALQLISRQTFYPELREAFARALNDHFTGARRAPPADSSLARRLIFHERLGFDKREIRFLRQERVRNFVAELNAQVRQGRPLDEEFFANHDIATLLQEGDPALRKLSSKGVEAVRSSWLYMNLLEEFRYELSVYLKKASVKEAKDAESPVSARLELYGWFGENFTKDFAQATRPR